MLNDQILCHQNSESVWYYKIKFKIQIAGCHCDFDFTQNQLQY